MVEDLRAPGGPPVPPAPDPLGGLRNVRVVSFERRPIQTREESAIRSAWIMTVASDQGEGTLSLVELSPTVSLYRGDGVFLGWPAQRLAAAYHVLRPPPDQPNFEIHQLG